MRFLYCLAIIVLVASCQSREEMDVIIINGEVYTGIDSISHPYTIAIKDDMITYCSDASNAPTKSKRVIDATGMIVCPGFIDPHTHADRDLIKSNTADNLPFLMQGVTTVIVGSDGQGFFPKKRYDSIYESHGVGTNVVQMIGHGTLRKLVVGRSDRYASQEEISKMCHLIEQEMIAGAYGLSTGLYYAPGSYSNTNEIIQLSKIAAKHGGVYESHIRDEASYSVGLKAAVEEAINISREASIPVQIAHIKCLGTDVWHESNAIISKVNSARNQGLNITANQYPYVASATGLQSAVVPRWVESGGKDSIYIRLSDKQLRKRILKETNTNITKRGGADKLLFVHLKDSTLRGKTLAEVARRYNCSPEEAVYKVLKNQNIRIASFNMTQTDVENFMSQSWTMTGSDGNTGHPRKYGTFPRVYNTYVKKEGLLTLAEFVSRSSSLTADFFNISKRGKLLKDHFADILIFDPKSYQDNADYIDAFRYAQGVNWVIVNGEVVIDNGRFTNKRAGKILNRQRN